MVLKKECVAAVSVVFMSINLDDEKREWVKLTEEKSEDDYYMIYSCPLDVDLTTLEHYPSLEISKDDFNF